MNEHNTSDPIRILHVVGSLGIGGIQSYLMELYRHMDRTRVQFDFVVHIKTDQSYSEEIRSLGGKVYYIDDDAFEKKNWGAYRNYWKKFFLEHQEYKIVHGHLRSTSAIYLRTAKKAGCFTVAHSHATSNGYGKSAKAKDVLQFPTRYIADFCMGCSKQANEWMFGKRRANSDTCIVLHNAIDVKKFTFDEGVRDVVRQELGIKEGAFVIGTVGRLVEQKNQQVLISAMTIVVRTIRDALLIIVGDGPLKEKLESQVKTFGLEKNVRMLGSRSDVDSLLNAFDVFALPSKDEGLGISAIEAQANGIPVLVSVAVPEETRITEQVEVVRDEQEWARCIIEDQAKKRKDVSADLISAGYDINEVARWLCQFYRERSKG